MRTIEVVEYRKEWNQEFQQEAELLQHTIGTLNPFIHHIGSTAVAGLAAKPIIDILIEIDDINAIDKYRSKIEQIGYVAKGEFGIPGRRYFQKGGDKRSHQIHAFSRSDPNVERHLAFRDYLISHPEIASEYAILKASVAAGCNNSIEEYCDGKNDFVQCHEKKAVVWYALNKQMQRTS